MMRTWPKFIMIGLGALVILWGGMFGFANPTTCTWPEIEEFIASSGLPNASVAGELESESVTGFEAAMSRAIVRRGVSNQPFVPERDFIEHALPGSVRAWRYRDGHFVVVDPSVAREAMESPVDMAAFFAGDFPRVFRFAALEASGSHACVIVEMDEAAGGMNYFEFWQLFRAGFGYGPWRVLPLGGVFYGW